MKTLNDLFLDELADMYDAEKRITKALPKFAKAASNPSLQRAFENHLSETQNQVERVEKVFECFEEKAKGKKCEGITGIIEEGDEIAAQFKGSPACDAALISAAEKVEHYEIASYNTLIEWAEQLGKQDAVDILQSILDEEMNASEVLAEVARTESNEEALGENEESESENAST
jgi:ferritin-like metal-binding protein YciE